MNNVLLIGKGYWGKNWYNTLLKTKTKFSVVEPTLRSSVDENGIQNYNSLASVNLDEFTHAIVSTNAYCHVETYEVLQKRLLNHRILVEKPCGTTLEEAHDLVKCFPGYIQLHSPAFNYIRSHFNLIGKPHLFKSNRASMGPRLRNDVTVVEDYMIHDLYIFIEMFGFPENIRVEFSKLTSRLFNCPSDTALVSLVHEKYPIHAELFSSWCYPKKERTLIISGDNGSFIWTNDDLYYNSSKYQIREGKDTYGNTDNHLLLSTDVKVNLPTKSVMECELENLLNDEPKGGQYIIDVWKLMNKILDF
jgi:predicted dehydrogenase